MEICSQNSLQRICFEEHLWMAAFSYGLLDLLGVTPVNNKGRSRKHEQAEPSGCDTVWQLGEEMGRKDDWVGRASHWRIAQWSSFTVKPHCPWAAPSQCLSIVGLWLLVRYFQKWQHWLTDSQQTPCRCSQNCLLIAHNFVHNKSVQSVPVSSFKESIKR